jgi:hypothetical protein
MLHGYMFFLLNVISSWGPIIEQGGNEFYTNLDSITNATKDTMRPTPYIIKSLKEVKLTAPKIPYELSGDTMTYDVNKYKSIETLKIEDILKKIDGFSVDPTGKISFLGKEIRKIYLDGDDIAGSQYTLLSKVIQSNSVSKIQLINNYSENRLLKEFTSSSDLALNLRMSNEVKNRVNANLKADYSIKKYGELDVSQLSMYKKFKAVSSITANNIGKGEIKQFNNLMNSSDEKSSLENKLNLINNFIHPGKITPPYLKQTYTHFNNDKQLSTYCTIRPTQNSHLRILGASNNLKLLLQDFSNQTIKSIQNIWYLESSLNTKDYSKSAQYAMEYNLDNARNRILTYKVYLKSIQNITHYSEARLTNILDTINQKMILVDKDYHIALNETFKIRQKNILSIEYNYGRQTIANIQYVTSTLPEKIIYSKVIMSSYRQNYVNRVYTHYFNMYLLSKKKYGSLTYGFILNKLNSNSCNRVYNDIVQKDTPLINIPYQYEIINSSFYTNVLLQKYKYFTYALYSSIGYSNSFISSSMKLNSLIYNYHMTFSYKRRPLSILSLEILGKNAGNDLHTNFPYPLLSGISSTLYGNNNISISKVVYIIAQYNYTNLYRAFSFSYSISGIHSSGDYFLSSNLNPNNTILTFFKNSGTNQLSVFCKMDKYVHPLKLKFTYICQFNSSQMPNLIDGITDNSSMYNTTNDIGVTSSWDSKIQMEFHFLKNSSSYHSKTLNSIIDKSMRNIEIGSKINYHISKNAMIVLHSKNIMSKIQSSLNLLDGIFQFRNKKNILFTFTLHNLLKENLFTERIIFQNSVVERKYNMVPRYFMIGLNYSF